MPFPDLAGRLAEVRQRIAAAAARGAGQPVTVVAVTKTHPAEAVRAAYALGIRDVGENRVQEAVPKMDAAGVPVRWHLIGHLQRNKARWADRFQLVHSVDSRRVAESLDTVGRQRDLPVDVLLQVNVLGERSKTGVAPGELDAVAGAVAALEGTRVLGVMTMAPLDADERTLRAVFAGARQALETVRRAGHAAARELSMGMSGDYEVAVEEGATIVRLGTVLFGGRAT